MASSIARSWSGCSVMVMSVFRNAPPRRRRRANSIP
jgi:hypothetical protein